MTKQKIKYGALRYGARTGKYQVVCKCPAEGCGRLHAEFWDVKPIIIPRRYCPAHLYLRGDNGEGSGYFLEKRTGFRKGRS